MITRLFTTIFVCSLGIGAMLAATPDKTRKAERTGAELCAELAVEVEISAQQGLLAPREAQQIIDRCYLLFGAK